MTLFKSKHQKLILQCYPPGKHVDKKANPSELSYLLYYASTRRVKLEKVIVFLERKTRSDASHSRAGNLHVTLEILRSLITKCADDVNVIASDVVSILLTTAAINDLALCKSVVATYETLCAHLDSGLFSGDQLFVNSFTVLSEQLINLSGDQTHAAEYQMLRTQAIDAASPVYNFNQELGRRLIAISVPPLMDAIHSVADTKELEARVSAYTSRDEADLAKVTSRSRAEQEERLHEALDSGNVSQADVGDATFAALQVLFDSTSAWQVSELTKAALTQATAANYHPKWAATFVELCTTYVPVQIRFITLGTLLSRLSGLSKKSSATQDNYDAQLLYGQCVLTLVSSQVSMIGLSVSDVIQQLLSLQSNLVMHQSAYLPKEAVRELSLVYSDCICQVSTRIYYYDQVPDAVSEILVKVNSLFVSGRSSSSVDQVHGLIISFLDDIQEIFSLLSKNKAAISRNHVSFEHWESSLPIISANPRQYKFSAKQFAHIQDKYLQVFSDLIAKELASDANGTPEASPRADPRRKSITGTPNINHAKIDNSPQTYLEPNYQQCITERDNFVTNLLIHVDKYLGHDQPLEAAQLMNDLLVDLVFVLGINFTANFVPFFYHWVSGDSMAHEAVLKSTFGFTVMFWNLKVLDTKYPGCKGYVGSSKFYADLQSDINSRKNNSMWVFDIDQDVGGPATSTVNAVTFQSTKQNLSEFVEGNDFIEAWIDVNAPLILDLNKPWQPSVPQSGVHTPHSNRSAAPDTTDIDSHLSYSMSKNGSRLGLGSANDISSIHSELMHQANGPAFLRGPLPQLPQLNLLDHQSPTSAPTNGYAGHAAITHSSVITPDYKILNTPKVTDLREAMSRKQSKPASTQRVALSRSAVMSDVNSILGGLEDEDDRMIVV
ncbi:hypothetical protein DICA4_F34662 [Diutina catenulata]